MSACFYNVRKSILATLVLCTLAASASAATILGANIDTASQVGAGPVSSRTDTVIDPGVEINFGDAHSFNWMRAGDSINFAPYPNPDAPWSIDMLFGASHDFAPNTPLVLTFTLPPTLNYGAAAIIRVDTIQQINAAKNANVMAVTINDMWQVSQGDFGGRLQIIFNAVEVPEPASGLLAACGGLLLRRPRNGFFRFW